MFTKTKITRVLTLLALTVVFSVCKAAPQSDFNNAVEQVKKGMKEAGFSTDDDLKNNRYMEQNKKIKVPCKSTSYTGWDGFPLERCEYESKDESKSTLFVIMLNPSIDQLAKWIASACLEANISNKQICGYSYIRWINGQSNAQFPIAGLVDESYDSCQDICYFTFRDGIAVELKNIGEQYEQPEHNRLIKKFELTIDSENEILNAKFTNPGDKARIASTKLCWLSLWLKDHPEDKPTPEFLKEHPKLKFPYVLNSEEYPDLIKYYYQLAWDNNRFVLMNAWANLHKECLERKSDENCDPVKK